MNVVFREFSPGLRRYCVKLNLLVTKFHCLPVSWNESSKNFNVMLFSFYDSWDSVNLSWRHVYVLSRRRYLHPLYLKQVESERRRKSAWSCPPPRPWRCWAERSSAASRAPGGCSGWGSPWAGLWNPLRTTSEHNGWGGQRGRRERRADKKPTAESGRGLGTWVKVLCNNEFGFFSLWASSTTSTFQLHLRSRHGLHPDEEIKYFSFWISKYVNPTNPKCLEHRQHIRRLCVFIGKENKSAVPDFLGGHRVGVGLPSTGEATYCIQQAFAP